MYNKIIWFCIFFKSCASVQFLDYGGSLENLESAYYQLKKTKTVAVSRYYVWLLDLDERAILCEALFRADFFARKNKVKYVDKNAMDHFYKLTIHQFPTVELHYLKRQNGNKMEVTAAYPATDMRVDFPDTQPKELVFPCLGQSTTAKGTLWVEIFISSGFRQNVFFAFGRDAHRNLKPIGLFIGTDPQVMSTNQCTLEHFYLEQRSIFELFNRNSDDQGDFEKLTPAVINAVVNIVFRSSLMEQKEILFRNRPADINYTICKRFLVFEEIVSEGEDSDSSRSGREPVETEALSDGIDSSDSKSGSGSRSITWSKVRSAGKKSSAKMRESSGCCSISSNAVRDQTKGKQAITEMVPMVVNVIEVTAYVGGHWKTPVTFAIGRSYDDRKSVFVFKSTSDKDKLVLFGYLSNVMILH